MVTHSLHSILLDYFFRAESVERINLHTEAFGNTGYVATYVTISVDTQFLAQCLVGQCADTAVALQCALAYLEQHAQKPDANGGFKPLQGIPKEFP